jgi:phenylacetate-CoA ligase
MGILMAEEVEKRHLREKIALKKLIMGSERSSDAQRKKMKELLGVEHVFDIPGLTELYGPGTGLDCIYHEGIHYWADYYILELLNPETLQPVPPGEIGEMVITTLRKEAAPLVRYRLLGRSDDMFIIRAVNIYPGQIDHILSNTKGVGSEYQIHLARKEDGKDYMTIKVERTEGGNPAEDPTLARTIEEEIKKQILVSGKVEIVNYGTLPRSERKSKRVFDNRGI